MASAGTGRSWSRRFSDEQGDLPVIVLAPDATPAAGYLEAGATRVLGRMGPGAALRRHIARALAARAGRMPGGALGDRAGFEAWLPALHSRQVNHRQPYTVALAGIDHAAAYRTRYGEVALRRVLDDVARRLAADVRGQDQIAPYGPTEVAMLFADLSTDRAATVLDRLRALVAAACLEHAGHPRLGVLTISVGAAAWMPGTETTPDRLLRRADTALYAARAAGQNAVVVADRMEAAGIEMSS